MEKKKKKKKKKKKIAPFKNVSRDISITKRSIVDDSDFQSGSAAYFPKVPGESERNMPLVTSNGPAAARGGIVAGSIAGWTPIERREGEGFGLPFQDRSDLESHQFVESHPATSSDDALHNLKGRRHSIVTIMPSLDNAENDRTEAVNTSSDRADICENDVADDDWALFGREDLKKKKERKKQRVSDLYPYDKK